ncbi:MAG: preprotein translocase subunit SecA [Sulfuricurvum sp.]|nr:preprotein translocase subunit SecA [Sulfuricurvum sp.]
MLQSLVGKIFGTQNDREVKKYLKRVEQINAREAHFAALSDGDLQNAFNTLKESVRSQAQTLDDVLVDSFAITREASHRVLGMRHFDVQLIGGMVLHEGRIAEMKTGEGKTLVATLAVILNAMNGKGVHVVTVNDYLASRDGTQMSALYGFLGYETGVILEGEYNPANKRLQYGADITYGTNNEFGFDYLRDNMTYTKEHMVQRGHSFVIVDEVDSILIDEARTPLIISGPTNRTLENYTRADAVAKALIREEHFTVDEKDRIILITEEGIIKAEELFEVDNLYSVENSSLSHHLDQALKANYIFVADVDYVLQNDQVVIVDEFTGRLSEGRRYSEGLHQALEAKEGVIIKEETQTLADITFQNYFRMYSKIGGMTGTAQTEATEFAQIYSLDVISIPTNVTVIRQDLNDLIYKTEAEKFAAVIAKVKELHAKGQPILIGTASIEKSEKLHQLIKGEKIPHTVLNAKNHTQESEIIKNAGEKGAVTIATNMAGRGVDIKVNEEIKALGGLYIIGTERHENRRIDNQLRGRSGRQGDPGTSQFYLSLEDSLLRIFGSDKIKAIMERLGVEDGEYIESAMVTRAVEKAQKKVENMHFEGRKHIVEYDDVANEQRKIVYKFRYELLDPNYDVSHKIDSIRDEYTQQLLSECGIYNGVSTEEIDTEHLKKRILEEVNIDVNMEFSNEITYETLLERIRTEIKGHYDAKMSPIDAQTRSAIEREIILKTLDSAWREHLYQMDSMKTGIRLRAYNQKDPLVEYKKESYNLFTELIVAIKFDSIKTLHIIQFRVDNVEEEAEALAHQMEIQKRQEELQMSLMGAPSELESSKIARNDDCPCGSGLKYKNCCGKSGPKKGAFAS